MTSTGAMPDSISASPSAHIIAWARISRAPRRLSRSRSSSVACRVCGSTSSARSRHTDTRFASLPRLSQSGIDSAECSRAVTDIITMTLGEVHALTTGVFLAHRVSPDQTRALADVITAAERDQCRSHGLFRIPGYLKSVVSGRVRRDAVPQLTQLAPGVIRVDAQMGFAPLALERGHAGLVEAAHAQGIAALSVVNAHHFAALWPEVEAVAEQGLVVFAFLSNSSFVAPPGGNRRLFGTNPMAFAWPRVGKPPMLFDQASSASARGEILMRQRAGEKIPPGWAITTDGQPTTDPTEALAGAQLPFGGHKGGAIALM